GAAGADGPLDAGCSADGRTAREISTTLSGRWGSAGSSSAAGAGGGGAAAFAGSVFAGSGFASAAAFGAGAAAPSSTLRMAWPTFTLSPALTLISLIFPATDEGTSIVALSVSSSRTG